LWEGLVAAYTDFHLIESHLTKRVVCQTDLSVAAGQLLKN